jgi:hypothetical protein
LKVLYLTDPGLDYLADQIYTGLCKVLGHGDIVDYPYKGSYHDPSVKTYWLPQNSGRCYEQEEIIALLQAHAFDLVVLSSPRHDSIAVLEALAAKASLPPLVFLDGEDDSRVRIDLFRRFNVALYFKRECKLTAEWWRTWTIGWRSRAADQELSGRVFPLPFSVILETIPRIASPMREVDISYAGRASHRKRVRAVQLLRQAGDIRFEGGVYAEPTDRRSKVAASLGARLMAKLTGDPQVTTAEQGTKLTPTEYYKLLGRSKMALSVRGGGFDTLRYWEAVACGSLLLSEWPDITIPDNFEHRRHVIFCRADLSDLVSLVRYYQDHDYERQSIAAEGYAHLLKHHTCERRAEYFLETCRKAL